MFRITSFILSVALVSPGLSASTGTTAVVPHPSPDDIALRSLNSRTFHHPDGSLTTQVYCGHIHYLDENTGRFEIIDTTIRRDVDGHYAMREASYHVRLADRLDAGRSPIEFLANGQCLAFMPRGVFWRNRAGDEQLIGLVRAGIEAEVAGSQLTYRDAFGPGIHLEILCQEDGMAKIVAFDAPQVLPVPTIADAYLAIDYEWTSDVNATPVAETVLREDGTSFSTTTAVRFEAAGTGREPARIWKPQVWDANGRYRPIELQFRTAEGRRILTKVLDREYLATATWPVRTDDVASFYTGPGDGGVTHWMPSGYNWTHSRTAGDGDIHLSNTGPSANPDDIPVAVGSYSGVTQVGIVRGFFPIDTSSLPDSISVSAASLTFYVYSLSNQRAGTKSICLTGQSQASNASLSNDDYDNITLNSPVEYASRTWLGSLTTSSYNQISLNASGRAAISTTGYTKLCMRHSDDVDNNPPTSDGESHYRGNWSEYTGTSRDPYLSLTYTIVNQAPTAFSLSSPADQSSTSDSTPKFTWQASTDPESQPITYTLKLSTDAGFTEPVYRTVYDLTTPAYSPIIGEDLANGTYYWKVIASDGAIQTTSSQTWQITINATQPSSPVITGLSSDLAGDTIARVMGTIPAAQAGNTLTLYRWNGSQYVAVAGNMTQSGTTFVFTPDAGIAQGSRIYVYSDDGQGGTDTSDTHVLTVDNVSDVFQDTSVYHGTGPGTSTRLNGDTRCRFRIAVNAGSLVTVSAYLRKNGSYAGTAPSITLTGLGINSSASLTGGADTWQQLAVSGTPNSDGVLTLTVETSSTAAGASTWIDDISVSQ